MSIPAGMWVALALAGDGDEERRARMDPLSRALLIPKTYELADPDFARLQPETVKFENAQGVELRGLWFENGETDRTVLVCMGNTGNASWMVPFAAILHDGGFDVLLFDYQGFGPSEGVATLLSLPGDALAAWNFLVEQKGRKPEQIGVLGISLGSVLALQLAAEQQPRACAVEDVFFPDRQLEGVVGDDTATRLALAGVKALVLPKIDPRVNARKFRGPLFLMHGDRDRLLTPMATVELAALRRERTRAWILAHTGHSPDSLQIDEWEFRDQLAGFFQDAFAEELTKEPRASFELPSSDASAELRIVVTTDRDRAVQVTLVGEEEGGRPRFHHECRRVTADQTVFTCSPGFAPKYAIATTMRHAVDLGDGRFGPELSPLSRSLADFDEFARATLLSAEIDLHRKWVQQGAGSGMSEQRLFLRSALHWRKASQLLPEPEEVHPRVRPRYALWLAQLSDELDVTRLVDAEADPVEAAEAMVDFLPPDPANFVTLGNAFIDVGFGSPAVRHALLRLVDARVAADDLEGAKALLDEAVKYRDR